jgi:hypothetical protein
MKCVPECDLDRISDDVPEYYPVQQRRVSRSLLLHSLVATGSLMIARRY